MKLRTRIVATYVTISTAGIVLVGVFGYLQIMRYLEQRLESSIARHIDSITELLISHTVVIDSLGSGDALLDKLARVANVRLTLIDKHGRPVYDSSVPRHSLPEMDDHINRPEIREAMLGRLGSEIRESRSVGAEFMYLARRITHPALGPLDSSFVRAAVSVDEVAVVGTHVRSIIIAVGTAVVLVMIAVSLHLSGRISTPIASIVRTTQAIKNGDLKQRILVTSRDEIGELATAINDMAEKLGSDIAQLRKLERVRSEFLGNVSHELRTPIFSMQGFIETLLDGAIDDPQVNREFMEKVYRHSERLNTLLNDLIEISRIESGEMKMSFRYFAVAPLLRQVVEEMTADATKKQISLDADVNGHSVEEVYGDRERIKQVLINLVDNAIKYTEAGGKVICRLHPEGSVCHISVEDTGCGIDQAHLPRLFERFYRVDRNRSRAVGGTGLGLAIVKHIIEAHGGSIQVRSEVGKGSVFTFILKRWIPV